VGAALRVVSWNIRAAIGPGPFPDRWWSRIDADRLRAIGALIVGDLNAPIEAEELAAFESWADAFVEPRGHAARVTTDDGWRIDHALARGASVSPARVLRAAGELSDHYPILVEVAAP